RHGENRSTPTLVCLALERQRQRQRLYAIRRAVRDDRRHSRRHHLSHIARSLTPSSSRLSVSSAQAFESYDESAVSPLPQCRLPCTGSRETRTLGCVWKS